MGDRRSKEEIRDNDLANFIVSVRRWSSASVDLKRNMMLIHNLSNKIFRHYIGYTADGSYRLRYKDERCFAQDLKKKAVSDPFRHVVRENPRLARQEDEPD